MQSQKIWSFCSGPCVLPKEVLIEAQKEMLDFRGSGQSVMELSHRSKEFDGIIKETEQSLRELLQIPENWKVLFMTGGATGQFACVPLNLMNGNKKACYAVNGAWGEKALQECKKYGEVVNCHDFQCLKKDQYVTLNDDYSNWQIDQDAAYIHYTDNETIMGVEHHGVPDSKGITLVCDMSSNFCSRPIDFSKFGCIYAGAQKNAGPAGVTIILIRQDLLLLNKPNTIPTVMDYKITSDNDSMYNTPPCWNIYICGLFFKYMIQKGGIYYWQNLSSQKSQLLYTTIDNSNGFYSCPIDKKCRSRMNIVFVLKNPDLESQFIKEAKEAGLVQLSGHKSVGGFRASIYNGMTIEGVQALCQFMDQFSTQHQ